MKLLSCKQIKLGRLLETFKWLNSNSEINLKEPIQYYESRIITRYLTILINNPWTYRFLRIPAEWFYIPINKLVCGWCLYTFFSFVGFPSSVWASCRRIANNIHCIFLPNVLWIFSYRCWKRTSNVENNILCISGVRALQEALW